MIHTQIREEMHEAMKERADLKLSVLRGLLSSFTNEAVASGKKPDAALSDEEALAVIKRSAKQRRESIEQFRAGGREDLAKREEEELVILEKYLPEQMAPEEIEKIAKMKKEELGVTDKSESGKLVGAVMKEIAGAADGKVVKEVVEKLFS
jgi:uncharacterized protein